MVVPLPLCFPSANQKPFGSSGSYPIGQRPQSADRQGIAEEGDWPTAPRGRMTRSATERAETVTKSQTRHLEPDYDNEI